MNEIVNFLANINWLQILKDLGLYAYTYLLIVTTYYAISETINDKYGRNTEGIIMISAFLWSFIIMKLFN